CNSLHRSCNILTKPQLPTRVIDVGTEATSPRLFESSGKRANYITLSHCWGNTEHQPVQTTTQTLLQHYKEISWEALGQTFRDAILITRELGLQFLWIDSLCIIQDSGSDWETESAGMAEVYLNSLMTLAATASLNSSGRAIPEVADTFVRKPVRHGHDNICMKRGGIETGAPLLSRAWVYQETVMSPRTVHFHSEELIWECREDVSCECGYFKFPEVHEEIYGMARHVTNTWKSPFAMLQFDNKGLGSAENMLDEWYRIIDAYSGLKLTHDGDRLPALAGLACRFAEALDTSYLAGLWLSDLWKGLLWRRNSDVTCRRLSGPKATIPTWSWASI
ncbi:HET-domain-containing protein, partial [Hyaloscypha bicolor E]